MYSSMEEWEYVEGQPDLFEDIMMEVPQPLTSPVLSDNRTTPERCPCPLLPRYCTEEIPNISQDHQGNDVTHISTTETYLWDEEWCNVEIPTYDYTDDHNRRSEGQLTSSFLKSDDLNITQDTIEVKDTFTDVPSSFQHQDLLFDSFKQQLSSDSSQTVWINENQSALTANTSFSSSEYGKSCSLYDSQIHRQEEIFTCSHCGKYFIDKTDQVKQKRIYTMEKPYSCPECEKYFSNHIPHQGILTEETPYSCSDCGKNFSKKSNLVMHQRIHTGEKPYSCPECGKYFKQKVHLLNHQRIHTHEQPYSCSLCGNFFSNTSDLNTHHRSHKGYKPYSCLECGKPFSQKSNLIAHQRTHTGEKPYSCSECGKCFNLKSTLQKHQKIHTSENDGDVLQTNWT